MPHTFQAVGTCSYNGFTFSPNLETLGVSIEPVYDSAGRTVVFSVFRFELRDLRQTPDGSGTVDADMQEIRRRLMKPAGEFRYENKGLGNLIVNVGAGARDVVWGPKPRSLKWKLIGPGNAVEFTYAIEMALPDCDNAKYAFEVMEFNYRLQYAFDEFGDTTRTYSGFLRIPQTRLAADNRRLLDSADFYREKIWPPVPAGFRRLPPEFAISEDKCRLDFSIRDQQLPGPPPPPGVVAVEASHRMNSDKVYSAKWLGTVSASYQLSNNGNPIAAFGHFLRLLFDRASSGLRPDTGVFVLSMDLNEPDVYGHNRCAFSATYRLNTAFQNIVLHSGLWKPVPQNDYTRWAASMRELGIWTPRGRANLKAPPTDDLILDLCQPTKPIGPRGGTKPQQSTLRGALLNFQNPLPDPQRSWLAARNDVFVEQQDGSVLQALLPENVEEVKPLQSSLRTGLGLPADGNFQTVLRTGGIGFPSGDALAGAVAGFAGDNQYANSPGARQFAGNTDPPAIVYRPRSGPSNRVQYRARGQFRIHLRGFGVRAGYPIAPPTVLRVGGSAAVPMNRRGNGFVTGLMGSFFGVPVVKASWNLTFGLVDVPGAIAVPYNPQAR